MLAAGRIISRRGSSAAPLLARQFQGSGDKLQQPEPVPLRKLKDSFLDGTSSTYLEELEERYRSNPQSVDKSWASFFHSMGARRPRVWAARAAAAAAAARGARAPDSSHAGRAAAAGWWGMFGWIGCSEHSRPPHAASRRPAAAAGTATRRPPAALSPALQLWSQRKQGLSSSWQLLGGTSPHGRPPAPCRR